MQEQKTNEKHPTVPLKYSFSMAVPCPDGTSHKEALEIVDRLMPQARTRLRDLMPWTTDGKSALLAFAYPIEHDVQPLLASWLNDGVIYEYHLMRHE